MKASVHACVHQQRCTRGAFPKVCTKSLLAPTSAGKTAWQSCHIVAITPYRLCEGSGKKCALAPPVASGAPAGAIATVTVSETASTAAAPIAVAIAAAEATATATTKATATAGITRLHS
jgi:hypothetical protein